MKRRCSKWVTRLQPGPVHTLVTSSRATWQMQSNIKPWPILAPLHYHTHIAHARMAYPLTFQSLWGNALLQPQPSACHPIGAFRDNPKRAKEYQSWQVSYWWVKKHKSKHNTKPTIWIWKTTMISWKLDSRQKIDRFVPWILPGQGGTIAIGDLWETCVELGRIRTVLWF